MLRISTVVWGTLDDLGRRSIRSTLMATSTTATSGRRLACSTARGLTRFRHDLESPPRARESAQSLPHQRVSSASKIRTGSQALTQLRAAVAARERRRARLEVSPSESCFPAPRGLDRRDPRPSRPFRACRVCLARRSARIPFVSSSRPQPICFRSSKLASICCAGSPPQL